MPSTKKENIKDGNTAVIINKINKHGSTHNGSSLLEAVDQH